MGFVDLLKNSRKKLKRYVMHELALDYNTLCSTKYIFIMSPKKN